MWYRRCASPGIVVPDSSVLVCGSTAQQVRVQVRTNTYSDLGTAVRSSQ